MKTKQWLCLAALTTMINAPLNAGEWVIKAGGFWAQTDSSISTKAFDGKDFELDFEDHLNLEETQFLPFFEAGYKFNERHYVYADWRRLHRQARTKSTFGYTLPDNPDKGIVVGAAIDTRMDIDILRAGYGYSFYKTDKAEIGGSLGLHVMFIEMGFSGEIAGCIENNGTTICDGANTQGEVVDNSTTAPLPDLGLWADYKLSEDWTVGAHTQFFYISVDNTSGYLADLNASVSYHINPNWDVELGYNYYLVEANWNDTTLKYNYRGPMLNVAYRF
ncbi:MULTISPECIES: outer membrane beta-barrel protein [unclassified Agarivorans]|uniref:outer membrane beta-barrel protein n=1 Tax=unclassified Agarivorans TaxID=2636026 RepID=UPI0026E2B3BD|nr:MULTISPECIES: outer membrane beta-barrel protein [unclassified Agarivorans]MDO6685816.1 outer membrane beta-barrel protein [Agarivorans sp. 3_MG-2023]MDO6716069.1 outer membrane beta-barrel protein [Agarivorans sp. 2_MG-2023]